MKNMRVFSVILALSVILSLVALPVSATVPYGSEVAMSEGTASSMPWALVILIIIALAVISTILIIVIAAIIIIALVNRKKKAKGNDASVTGQIVDESK